jgi:hypothetical protein
MVHEEESGSHFEKCISIDLHDTHISEIYSREWYNNLFLFIEYTLSHREEIIISYAPNSKECPIYIFDCIDSIESCIDRSISCHALDREEDTPREPVPIIIIRDESARLCYDTSGGIWRFLTIDDES